MNTMTVTTVRVTPVRVTPISQAPSARVAAERRPSVPGGQVRLTRRGRLVVLVTVLLVAFAVSIALGAGSMATEEAGQRPPTDVVVINEGDTLWDIAAAVAEDGQVRSMVHEIRELNNLDSSVVSLGQRIHVPVAG